MLERYWVWEHSLFNYNPKRPDSTKKELTVEIVKASDAQQAVERLERERDTARKRVDELEAREVDVCVLRGEIADLQSKLAAAQADADRCRSIAFQAEPVKYWCEKYQALHAAHAQLREERNKWQASCNLVEAVMERNKLKAELTDLHAAHTALRGLVEQATKMLTELMIIPVGCSREQELSWKKAVKDLREAATLPREGWAQS